MTHTLFIKHAILSAMMMSCPLSHFNSSYLISRPLWWQSENLTESLNYTCDPVTVRFCVAEFILVFFSQEIVIF